MGELHLQIYSERMKREYGVENLTGNEEQERSAERGAGKLRGKLSEGEQGRVRKGDVK